MKITKACNEEFSEVYHFYNSLIDAIQGAKYHPKWKKDIYPAQADIRMAIEEGTLYIGRCEGRIAGAMVVNQEFNGEYVDVPWPAALEAGEFMVIHMLGVHRDFNGRGYAKQLVRYAAELAARAGMKAIRLDVVEGNLAACRLYETCGFVYVDTRKSYYEDTGWMEFDLYELKL